MVTEAVEIAGSEARPAQRLDPIPVQAGLAAGDWEIVEVPPDDPDSAYVIPLQADVDRVTPNGRMRVFETRDAGASWIERGDGLPQSHAYLTILRHAFSRATAGASLELYLGTTSGEVFGSADAGASWFTVASRLPPVYALTTSA